MTASAVETPLDFATTIRRLRLPLVVLLVFVLVALIAAVFGTSPTRQQLDPRDASPHGALALRRLVEAQGVRVTDVSDPSTITPRSDATVVIVDPTALTVAQLTLVATAATDVVVVAPTDRELSALGIGATESSDVDAATPSPTCSFPVAAAAGDVDYTGVVYTDASAEMTCYPEGDGAGLLVHDSSVGQIVVFGSAQTFANDHLAQHGNAALAIGLLAQRPDVEWVLPDLPSQRPADAGSQGLFDLLPARLLWAVAQLAVAVVALGLWRARRLGPIVAEPLPVVVRAVETVEGRARLLRTAHARPEAAASLRTAMVARLRDLLGLGAGSDASAVVAAVAARIGRPEAEVAAVLYGAEPSTDTALVALAGRLDEIERHVRHS